MADQVSARGARWSAWSACVEVVQRRAPERAQRFVGRTLEVLVEGPSRTDPTRLRGRSRHNKVVNFEGLGEPGELVQVEITAATSQTLTGETLLREVASGPGYGV